MHVRPQPKRRPLELSSFAATAPRRAPDSLLNLQRDAGNRAVGRLLGVQRSDGFADQIPPAPSNPGARGRIHLDGLGDFPFTSDVTWTMTNALKAVIDKNGPVVFEAGRIGIETLVFTTPMAGADRLLQHYSDMIRGIGPKSVLDGLLEVPGWHLLLYGTSLHALSRSGGDVKVHLKIGRVEVGGAGPTRTPKDRKEFKGWLRFDGAPASQTPVLAWDELRSPTRGWVIDCKVLPSREMAKFVNNTMSKGYPGPNLCYEPKSGAAVELYGVHIKRVQSTTSGGHTVLEVRLVAELARADKKRRTREGGRS